jgi:hypothetical protein
VSCRNRRKNIDLTSKVDVEKESSAKLSPTTRTERPLSYETSCISLPAWINQKKKEKTQNSIAIEWLGDPKLNSPRRTRRTKAPLYLNQEENKNLHSLKRTRRKAPLGGGRHGASLLLKHL